VGDWNYLAMVVMNHNGDDYHLHAKVYFLGMRMNHHDGDHLVNLTHRYAMVFVLD
jgi:hypothetical protein